MISKLLIPLHDYIQKLLNSDVNPHVFRPRDQPWCELNKCRKEAIRTLTESLTLNGLQYLLLPKLDLPYNWSPYTIYRQIHCLDMSTILTRHPKGISTSVTEYHPSWLDSTNQRCNDDDWQTCLKNLNINQPGTGPCFIGLWHCRENKGLWLRCPLAVALVRIQDQAFDDFCTVEEFRRDPFVEQGSYNIVQSRQFRAAPRFMR